MALVPRGGTLGVRDPRAASVAPVPPGAASPALAPPPPALGSTLQHGRRGALGAISASLAPKSSAEISHLPTPSLPPPHDPRVNCPVGTSENPSAGIKKCGGYMLKNCGVAVAHDYRRARVGKQRRRRDRRARREGPRDREDQGDARARRKNGARPPTRALFSRRGRPSERRRPRGGAAHGPTGTSARAAWCVSGRVRAHGRLLLHPPGALRKR